MKQILVLFTTVDDQIIRITRLGAYHLFKIRTRMQLKIYLKFSIFYRKKYCCVLNNTVTHKSVRTHECLFSLIYRKISLSALHFSF